MGIYDIHSGSPILVKHCLARRENGVSVFVVDSGGERVRFAPWGGMGPTSTKILTVVKHANDTVFFSGRRRVFSFKLKEGRLPLENLAKGNTTRDIFEARISEQ